MTTITRPTYMSLNDWADQIILDLDAYGSFGRLDDVTQWQNWAVQFLNNTDIGKNPPNPFQYDNWQDWAERLCQCLI